MDTEAIAVSIPYEEVFVPDLGVILIPRLAMDHLRAQGRKGFTATFSISGVDGPQPEWLTVSDAARLHIEDVDGLTLDMAKGRVSWAASRDAFVWVGRGRDRRIDPVSFNAWRLKQRDKNLDRLDTRINEG